MKRGVNTHGLQPLGRQKPKTVIGWMGRAGKVDWNRKIWRNIRVIGE